MFLDMFPGALIGFVHDRKPAHNMCREAVKWDESYIEDAKAEGYGVFFTPNGHGLVKNPKGTLLRWDGNVTRLNACFADFDAHSKEKQLEMIKNMPLPVSMTIESKRGYHAYWMLNEDTPADGNTISLWRRIQDTIAEKYGADRACKNPSRLMRMPGSYHVKNIHDPYLVSIKEFNTNRYSISELEIAFPPKPRAIYLPINQRQSKKVSIPPFQALREGERHPTLCRVAGQMFVNSKPSDEPYIRQALKIWYSMSCINLKDNWEREVDKVCDWTSAKEYNQ